MEQRLQPAAKMSAASGTLSAYPQASLTEEIPTVELELYEAYSETWSEMSANSPSPRPDISASDVGVASYALPADLYSDGLIGVHVNQGGYIEGSVVDLGDGTLISNHYHRTGAVLDSIVSGFKFANGTTYTVVVAAGDIGYFETSASFTQVVSASEPSCGDAVQAAVSKGLVIGLAVTAAVIVIPELIEVAAVGRVAAQLFPYVPAARTITRKAWGAIGAAGAVIWDAVNDMRDKINTAVNAC